MQQVNITVRMAVQEDIPQIQSVSKEAFAMYAEGAGITSIVGELNESNEYLKEEIQNKLVFVALDEETIVGCVRVEVNDDQTAYLSRFGVKREYQNKGIGQILMNEVDIMMLKLGIYRLYLHTASRMLSLVRFYYGRGFYIESTTNDRGYIRALLCKEFEIQYSSFELSVECENLAIV